MTDEPNTQIDPTDELAKSADSAQADVNLIEKQDEINNSNANSSSDHLEIEPSSGEPSDPLGGSEEDEWEEVEVVEEVVQDAAGAIDESGNPQKIVRKVKKRKRHIKPDAAEINLQGRRELCKRIPDIAANMLKTVKLRVLGRYLQSVRGLEDEDLTNIIRKDFVKIAEPSRILRVVNAHDTDFARGQLKVIILNILLQEEIHSLEESKLEERVIEFEKELVKKSKTLDFFDQKKHDADRWHHYDTYRIVLAAAWKNDTSISQDEANLLGVLRDHLTISLEEHWLISAHLKKFPKEKCALHTPDEINEARKELQRDGLLWSYRDEANRNIDILPLEIATVLRKQWSGQELQHTNYRRLLQHDVILLSDLKNILIRRNMDRYGVKSDLIERLVHSNVRPSEVLNDLDRQKLSDMCSYVGLRSSGNKTDLSERLIEFYDDLTFVERITRDSREICYNNYELLAARSYSELRAKKLISKDLEIEHMFEKATEFLFEVKLGVKCDRTRKDNLADGKIPLENNQLFLWDCKSAESPINLQDFLESQFDGYLRKERDAGRVPLAFLVIAPSFTPNSLKIAYQYKAKTNWDVALVVADGLKHLAEQWSLAEPNKTFPIRLFNRTELIDKERAELLLSLA